MNSRKRINRYFMPYMLVLAAGTSQSALANQSGTVAREEGAAIIDDIVVTATKRQESQQRVPLAVTAFDAERIAQVRAINLTSLSAQSPNVQLGNFLSFPTGTAYFIRGIGAAAVNNTVDPAVATFVDGVYIAAIGVGVPDLFDVERVEILRGPQGTLFGRNTTAGAVLIRSRRPSGNFGGEASVTVGSYGQHDFKAAIEAPLSDSIAVRLSGTSLNSDGYFRDAASGKRFGGLDVKSVRLAATFKPTDVLDFALIADYTLDKSEQFGGNCTAVASDNSLYPVFGGTCSPFLRRDGTEYTVQQNMIPHLHNKIWGVALEGNWDVGPGTITSITGYRDHDLYNTSDTDFSYAPLGNQNRQDRFKQFTQELRFASSFSDKFDFVAGGFFLDAQTKALQNVFAIQFNPTFSDPNARLSTYAQQKQRSAAAFFEGNYHLTDQLVVTGGLRYSWERKNLVYTPPIPLVFGGCNSSLGILSCPLITRARKSWNDLSPKVGVKFQMTPEILLYANYAKGFRSGGFNGAAGTPAGIGPYDPEKVDSFEVGAKTDLFDRRVRVNVAAFSNNYKGLQRGVFFAPNDRRTINAATARIQGIELETTALVADGLRFEGSFGWLDAKYKRFLADLNGDGIIDDNRNLHLQYAPKFNYRLGANYTRLIVDAVELGGNVEYIYSSSLDTQLRNDLRARRGATGLLNASISIADPGKKWAISLFGKNLTDKLYLQTGEVAGRTSIFRVPAAPRTLGVELKTKF